MYLSRETERERERERERLSVCVCVCAQEVGQGNNITPFVVYFPSIYWYNCVFSNKVSSYDPRPGIKVKGHYIA